jgi:diadenosine tetraphosphatase ApaH/serine/threonine PP2A family protein phosphatase
VQVSVVGLGEKFENAKIERFSQMLEQPTVGRQIDVGQYLLRQLSNRNEKFLENRPRQVGARNRSDRLTPHDARQIGDDMTWIRQPFLDSTEALGYTVVHGHSAVSSPEIRGNRIGLDTGAVWSGCLTAMVLTDAARDVLQT